MKKSIWITVISIIAIISLMFVFTACKDNDVTPVDPPTDGELSETTFFTAASQIEDPEIIISITVVEDNKTKEIYSRSSNGSETNPYNLPIDGGSYIDATANFEYRGDAFSSTSISGKLFTGEVENAKEFLGITDDSVSIENAEVVIELKGTNNVLKSIEVTFDIIISELSYKAKITLNP